MNSLCETVIQEMIELENDRIIEKTYIVKINGITSFQISMLLWSLPTAERLV